MAAGLDVDLSRFVQIVGTAGALGSGFRLSASRVLTAHHVIADSDSFWVRDPHLSQWWGSKESPAMVAWPSPADDTGSGELDAVLLETEPIDGVIPWTRLLGERNPRATHWESYGYPNKLVKEPKDRQHLQGTMFGSEAGDLEIGLSLSEGLPRTAEIWKGVSGAPVFARIASHGPWSLCGVLRTAWEGFDGSRLTAVAMPALLAAPGFRDALEVSDARSHCTGFLAQAALLVTKDLAQKVAAFHPRWQEVWRTSDLASLVDSICLETPTEEVCTALADAYCHLMDRSDVDAAAKVFELIHCTLPASYLSSQSIFPPHPTAEMRIRVFTPFLAEIANAGFDGNPIALTTPRDLELDPPLPVYQLPDPAEAGVDADGSQRSRDVIQGLAERLAVLQSGSSPEADRQALYYIAQIALRKPGGGRPTLSSQSQLAVFDRPGSGTPEEKAEAILAAIDRRLANEARQNRRFYFIADPTKPDTLAFLKHLRVRLSEIRPVILEGTPDQFETEDSVASAVQRVYLRKDKAAEEKP